MLGCQTKKPKNLKTIELDRTTNVASGNVSGVGIDEWWRWMNGIKIFKTNLIYQCKLDLCCVINFRLT